MFLPDQADAKRNFAQSSLLSFLSRKRGLLLPVVVDVLHVVIVFQHIDELLHVLDVGLVGKHGFFATFSVTLQDSNKFLSWVYVTTKLYCKITISQAKKRSRREAAPN